MSPREERHRAPAGRLVALALAGALAAAALTAAPAAARTAGAAPADPRCTPAGIEALTGTARAERRVRCLLNRQRAARRLAPLRYNRCLDRAAERHARDMVARRYFAHVSRLGATPAERARLTGYVPPTGAWTVAENIAWGSGLAASARAVVRGWMRSAAHRANILRPRHRDVGVAVVRGAPVGPRGRARGTASATYVVEFGARERPGRCGRPDRRAQRPARPAAHPRGLRSRPSLRARFPRSLARRPYVLAKRPQRPPTRRELLARRPTLPARPVRPDARPPAGPDGAVPDRWAARPLIPDGGPPRPLRRARPARP